MKHFKVYGHYGSQNHGNEAIIRGLSQLMKPTNITVYSYYPDKDKEYELDKECEIKPFLNRIKKYSLKHILIYITYRVIKNQLLYNYFILKSFFEIKNGIYLFEAGDQYCESDKIKDFYAYINKKLVNRKYMTIMLPCTIPEDAFTNNKLLKDLKRYNIIFARESITYNALLKAGFDKSARFAPCPAFIMKPKECELPAIFTTNRIVGITIGLLAQGKEKYSEKIYINVKELIQYLIHETDYAIALIPHVNVSEKLNDISLLQSLYNNYKDSGRIVMIKEQRADEQKYVIKNCSMYVTVRTHVSIAAYSSGVPTLVIGYSQKSKGIAQDLFGTSENYVISVESLETNDKLIQSFKWLSANEPQIRKRLNKVLPNYIEKINLIKSVLLENLGDKYE